MRRYLYLIWPVSVASSLNISHVTNFPNAYGVARSTPLFRNPSSVRHPHSVARRGSSQHTSPVVVVVVVVWPHIFFASRYTPSPCHSGCYLPHSLGWGLELGKDGDEEEKEIHPNRRKRLWMRCGSAPVFVIIGIIYYDLIRHGNEFSNFCGANSVLPASSPDRSKTPHLFRNLSMKMASSFFFL